MKKMIVFLYRLKTTSFVCAGGNFNIFTEKRNLQVSKISMCTFSFKYIDMEQYSTNVFKSVTSSGVINEKVDHWLDSFDKFHKKYIIMPSESLNVSFLEEISFITF